MKIKHDSITISVSDPFENCKLDRKKYATILTNLVGSYSEGFVLAINNEWGTGKTTFIKMWQQHLINHGYKTLHFNAWENDFESDPLVAIMGELKTLEPPTNDKAFKNLLQKGAVLTKNVLPALMKAIAVKYIDIKILTDAIENITKSATEILKAEVDEYANKKKGLIDFRIELERFIKLNNNEKPVVFFIDELDRCRPNYAVEVLEQVKHFFNVQGIVFVLSIDKMQLGNAIRGVYGSEKIDANEYLRRFIDIEYTIPAPKTAVFCRYLFDYFQFDDFLLSFDRMKHRELHSDRDNLLKMASTLFIAGNITLRQQEKVFAHARVVLNSFSSNNYLFPQLFILLIYMRDFSVEIYKKMRDKKFTPQALIDEIGKIFPDNIKEEDLRFFISIEAQFVQFYHNYYRETYHNNQIIERDDQSGKNKLLIKSAMDRKVNSDTLLSTIEILQTTGVHSIKLNYLLDKIDLMDSFSL